MLNTAGAYFIRESGGTFLGDKGHSCHPQSSANIDTTNESSK